MRACARNLDTPLLFWGLEYEDITVIAFVAGLVIIAGFALAGGAVFFGGWWGMAKFKKDKPLGYIMHWTYAKLGISWKGLLPPPQGIDFFTFKPVAKANRYSCVFKGNSKGRADVFSESE